MKVKSTELIDDLIERTKGVLNDFETLCQLPETALTYKPTPERWNALECLEHLNYYGDFYIPEISKRIEKNSTNPSDIFKSGWLGNYFAKSMLPKENLNTMNTFKTMNPIGKPLNLEVLDKFRKQQHTFLELLQKARKVNLQKTKTAISISKFIKLKLGDTFRVVIYHNQRHMVQALKAANL